MTAAADEAVLCLQGVLVELGPADQVTACNDIPGLVVVVLPDRGTL